jgi:hypothetical protein
VSGKVDTLLETTLKKMKRFKSTETEEKAGFLVLRHKVIVVSQAAVAGFVLTQCRSCKGALVYCGTKLY